MYPICGAKMELGWMKKRLIAAALVAGATPAFAAEGPVYAYCSAQDRNAKTYITQIYTITVDGLELGGKIPVGSTLVRSEEHTSELQSLMRISYAVFCLKKKKKNDTYKKKKDMRQDSTL